MSQMRKVVEPFLDRVDQALAADYSAVLYGSLARGDYLEGRSDINLMLVLDHLDFDVLAVLVEPYRFWVGHGQFPPLLLSRAEWDRAADVFPIEITDMTIAYKVLRGRDPLEDAEVSRPELRRSLEREFRGKLTRLRQGYLPAGSHPEGLGSLAQQSIGTIIVLMRCLLKLAGREGVADARRVLTMAGAMVGFTAAPLLESLEHRGDKRWACSRSLFEGYMTAVEKAVSYVDELQLGDAT
ncbi:MAG: nucleotidyltransferase domain-containing protein [Gemmatimonadales bacterium]